MNKTSCNLQEDHCYHSCYPKIYVGGQTFTLSYTNPTIVVIPYAIIILVEVASW